MRCPCCMGRGMLTNCGEAGPDHLLKCCVCNETGIVHRKRWRDIRGRTWKEIKARGLSWVEARKEKTA